MTRLEEIEERYNDVLDASLPSEARDARMCKLVIGDIPFLMGQITALTRNRDEGFELAMTESAPDYERVPRLFSLVHHLKAEIEKLKIEINQTIRY